LIDPSELSINNTDINMNKGAGTIGIRLENTGAVSAINLNGTGNTVINAATQSTTVDASSGFNGTIEIN
jgi:hypothetical protein